MTVMPACSDSKELIKRLTEEAGAGREDEGEGRAQGGDREEGAGEEEGRREEEACGEESRDRLAPMEGSMPVSRLKGIQLYFERAGEGPPLLFISGTGRHQTPASSSWRRQCSILDIPPCNSCRIDSRNAAAASEGWESSAAFIFAPRWSTADALS